MWKGSWGWSLLRWPKRPLALEQPRLAPVHVWVALEHEVFSRLSSPRPKRLVVWNRKKIHAPSKVFRTLNDANGTQNRLREREVSKRSVQELIRQFWSRNNRKGGTASLRSRTCVKRNAAFGARFKGLSLYFYIKMGNWYVSKRAWIHIWYVSKPVPPLWRYPPYDYSKEECKWALPRKNCKLPGFKQPGLPGLQVHKITLTLRNCFGINLQYYTYTF